MKMPLAMAVSKAWEAHRSSVPEGVHYSDQGPESQALEARARELEEVLAGRIKPHLDDYAEGLISASGLVHKLSWEGLQDYDA